RFDGRALRRAETDAMCADESLGGERDGNRRPRARERARRGRRRERLEVASQPRSVDDAGAAELLERREIGEPAEPAGGGVRVRAAADPSTVATRRASAARALRGAHAAGAASRADRSRT